MKTVSITGISRGIGKGLALKFLNSGYFVIGTSITGDIDFAHDNLKVFKLDLSKPESISACAEDVSGFLTGRGSTVDIHINNAGILLDDGEEEVVIEKLRATLEVNLIGNIDITQRLLPKVSVGGHIINISSSAGSMERVHHANYPAYKISKAALNMFTTYLAYRLKDRITVSSVHPGRVKTDMGSWEGDMEAEEAAEYIFKTATTKNLESGQFWYKCEKFPW